MRGFGFTKKFIQYNNSMYFLSVAVAVEKNIPHIHYVM